MESSRLRDLRCWSRTQQGGLDLLAIPMPWSHVVVAEFCLRVGSRYEDPTNNGLSHFLEHMLFRGTPGHPSAYKLALAFEERGASLSAFTATDHGTLAVAGPRETFDEVLRLLGEVCTSPIFDGIDIEKGIVREEILEGMDDRGIKVDADDLIRQVMFEDHPLGLPITGNLDRLDSFDVEGLRAHHRAYYTANNAILSIAGPIDPEHALEVATRSFGALDSGSRPTGEAPREPTSARWKYVRHSSSQTDLRLGFRAPASGSDLEPATELLVRILDDGMSTRLYHRICDLKGLCYDVSASYEAFADAGSFELAAETGHDNAEQVATELFTLAQELRDTGPTDREIEKAKSRFRWQLDEMLDQSGSVAEFYGMESLLGARRTPLERYEQLNSITRADLIRAAEATFRRDRLSLVAVGKLSRRAQGTLASLVEQF